MDQKTIYLIIFIIMAILVGAFFILYLKMKRIEKNNVELQKHIVYTNNIIETYINPTSQRSTSEPNLQQPNIPLQQTNIPQQQSQSHQNLQQLPKQQLPKQQVPNPMSTIGNMLPMMGTIMNMFGGESVASPEDIEEEAKQMMEEDQKRRELENEIQQELSELAVDVQEGRVDEEDIEEKDIEEEDDDIEDENFDDLNDDDDLESDEEFIIDSETDDMDLESDNGEELEEEDKTKNEDS